MSWVLDVGVSPGALPDGTLKRRQWRRCASRTREPLQSELVMLLQTFGATEIRATSVDGKLEIIWTRLYKARRVYL